MASYDDKSIGLASSLYQESERESQHATYNKVLHENARDLVVDRIAVALGPVRRQIINVVHNAHVVLVKEAAELVCNGFKQMVQLASEYLKSQMSSRGSASAPEIFWAESWKVHNVHRMLT
jgi:hypothetical protein